MPTHSIYSEHSNALDAFGEVFARHHAKKQQWPLNSNIHASASCRIDKKKRSHNHSSIPYPIPSLDAVAAGHRQRQSSKSKAKASIADYQFPRRPHAHQSTNARRSDALSSHLHRNTFVTPPPSSDMSSVASSVSPRTPPSGSAEPWVKVEDAHEAYIMLTEDYPPLDKVEKCETDVSYLAIEHKDNGLHLFESDLLFLDTDELALARWSRIQSSTALEEVDGYGRELRRGSSFTNEQLEEAFGMYINEDVCGDFGDSK